MNNTFTPQQLEDWHAYERVRTLGLFNMFSSEARTCSCLSKADYIFVLKNYSALREAANASNPIHD